MAQHDIYFDLFSYLSKLKITQSIQGLQKQQEAFDQAQKQLLQGSQFTNCTIVLGNFQQDTNNSTTATNSQLVTDSTNVTQSQSIITQLAEELTNTPTPAQPELAAQYQQLQNILNSNQPEQIKETKLQEKLTSFGTKALQELWNFGKDVGASVLTTYLETKFGL